MVYSVGYARQYFTQQAILGSDLLSRLCSAVVYSAGYARPWFAQQAMLGSGLLSRLC